MHPFTMQAIAAERRTDLVREAAMVTRAQAIPRPRRFRAAVGRPLMRLGALLAGETDRIIRLDQPAPRRIAIDEDMMETC